MKFFIVFAVVMAGLMLPSVGLAANVTFVGRANTQWSSGTNWSGGVVPGTGDNVFATTSGSQSWLTLSSTYSPSIANLTVSNDALRIFGNTGTLSVSGSINVTNANVAISTTGTSPTYYAIQTPLINANNATLLVLSNAWLTAGPNATWNFKNIELNTENSANKANLRINGAVVNSSDTNLDYGVMLTRSSAEAAAILIDSGTFTAVRIGIGRRQNNFQNAGTGTVEWTGGTIGNYSGQDLLINSYDTTDNYGLQVNLSGTADKTLSVAGSRTVRFGPNSNNKDNSGAISGTNTTGAYLTGSTGRLVVDGGGTVRLYQSNSYSGAVKINNGTLTLVSGTETYNSVFGTYNATIAPSALEIATSGTLDLQNGTGLTGSGSVTFTGGLGLLKFSGSTSADLSSRIVGSTGAIRIDTGTNAVTFASALTSSNTGGLVLFGSGPLTLSGSNAYVGQTLIANGARLNIDGNHSSVGDWNIQPTAVLAGSGTINLSNNANLAVYTTNTSPTFYAIQTPRITTPSGNSGLSVAEGATLTAGPGSTWDFGGVDLNPSSSSARATFRLAGAAINVGGNTSYSVMLSRTPNATSTLFMDSGTLTAVRIGIGRQQNNFQDAGTASTIEWTGGTIANFSGQDMLWNSYEITDNYGLQVNLVGADDKTLSVASGRTVRFGPNAINYTNTGAVSGTNTTGAYLTGSTGRFVVDGGGTVRLYQSNPYSGSMKINNGTLTLVSGTETFSSAFGTYNATIAPSALEIATNGTLELQNGSGLIGSGSVSFTGGLLRFSGSSAADLSSRIMGSSGAIRIDTGTNTVTFASALASSNSGGLTKSGAGALVLSGNNGYTGATTVSAGRLTVNGGLGGGAVSVAAGAVLAGSGTIGGTVTVSGTLSPGNSPGLLTLSSLVLTSTATTLMEIDGLARGSLYDGINLTTAGGLTYAGALSIAFGLGSAVPDQTTFDLFNFTGSPTGDFASVTSTGLYAGSWSQVSSGTWSLESGSQTLTFSTATGDIIVVPEPGAMLLAGLGIAAAGSLGWRRRWTSRTRQARA